MTTTATRTWNPAGAPIMERIAAMPDAHRREEIDRLLATYGDDGAEALRWDWTVWARPEQLPPPADWDWGTWLMMSGRGFGKTRTGAETIRAYATSGQHRYFGLVGATAADLRDVMIEGESGILAVHPDHERPIYEPSKSRLTWPTTGAVAWLRSADEPDRLRGVQAQIVWCDELGAWRRLSEAWSNLDFATRLGLRTWFIVTTTPRPKRVIRDLLYDPRTVVTRGSLYRNAANLSPDFVARIRERYEGTRTGRQEIHGEYLDAADGALWSRDVIDTTRVRADAVPQMQRIVVALDPADGNADGDEMAITVAGFGYDNDWYVIWNEGDRTSPRSWIVRAFQLAIHYGADTLVWEANRGGEWIAEIIRGVQREMGTSAGRIGSQPVHASRGKRTRAEPVAARYEQRRVHHVTPVDALSHPFDELEDQMVSFTGAPGEPSPDRLDATVWAITALDGGVGHAPDASQHRTTPDTGATERKRRNDDLMRAGF